MVTVKRIVDLRLLLVMVLWMAVFCPPGSARAEWETGIRGGYNSNIDHSIKDPQSDSYLSAYLSFTRGITGESRLNWAFETSVEGTGYLREEDLSYGELIAAPMVVYFIAPNWTVGVAPFLKGRAVGDSDQSAVTLGGKITMREGLNKTFYLSQFYLYSDSVASSSVYSKWEHILGASIGANWTRRFFTELGYQFSHGQSFRSNDNGRDTGGTDRPGSERGGGGKGRGRMHRHSKFSSTFDTTVFREIVDVHAVGATLGVDWSKKISSTASYTFSTAKGDSGTSHDHAFFMSLDYHF